MELLFADHFEAKGRSLRPNIDTWGNPLWTMYTKWYYLTNFCTEFWSPILHYPAQWARLRGINHSSSRIVMTGANTKPWNVVLTHAKPDEVLYTDFKEASRKTELSIKFKANTTRIKYCNGGYFSETSLRPRIPPARPRDPVIHIKPQAPKARGYCCRCLIRIQVRNKEQSLSPEPRLNGECWDTVTLALSTGYWSG